MRPLQTAGTSPERTFRSISFTSSSEWVMISGTGLSCLYPDERSPVTTSISKEYSAAPFLPSLFPLSPLYSVPTVSLLFFLCLSDCATALNLHLSSNHLSSSSNRVSSALATVSHYYVPAGMRGNVLICRRREAGLHVTQPVTASLQKHEQRLSLSKAFKRTGLNFHSGNNSTWLAQ